jgi:hypothetical protein
MMENMTNDVMNEVVVSEAKGVNVKDVAVKAGTAALGALAGYAIYKAVRFFMNKVSTKEEPEVAQGQPGPMGPQGPKGDTPSKEEIREVVKEVFEESVNDVFGENKTKSKEKTTETKAETKVEDKAEDKAETKADDKTEHQDK